MKQIIMLEKSDLARLKGGENIQLTEGLMLTVEHRAPRGPYKKPPPPPADTKPRATKRRMAPGTLHKPDVNGNYRCEHCGSIYGSWPALRGHLSKHVRVRKVKP